MTGRHLIFYFYAMPDYKSNPAYKMHFACLKRYSSVFDSSHFFISVDDISDRELFVNVATDIVSCGFVENLTFTVVKNNPIYRESTVFKEEIADNLDSHSGLTFFAHTKGVTNISDGASNTESILGWIFGCYYFSLEFLDEVHTQMQVFQPFCQRYFFGSFLKNVPPDEGGGTKYGPEYEGTFYWINCVPLKDYLDANKIRISGNFGRFYSERFPGEFFDINSLHVGSHLYTFHYGDALNLYKDSFEVAKLMYGNDYGKFKDEYNKIKTDNDI